MSIEIGFQKHTDKDKFVVNDVTVWSEEQPRVNYVLHLLASRYNGSTYVAIDSTPNFTIETASSWEVDGTLDGSFRIVLVACALWENVGYLKNSIVSDEGKVYLALKDTIAGIVTTDEEHWKLIENASALPLLAGSPNALLKVGYYLHDAHALLCIGEKSIAYAGEKCGCTDDCEAIKDWSWTMMFYNAALFSQGFGEYEEAGKFMNNVNARCGSGTSSNPCNCN